jgi:hypothetical protein
MSKKDSFNSFSSSSSSSRSRYKDHERMRTEEPSCSQDHISKCTAIWQLTAGSGTSPERRRPAPFMVTRRARSSGCNSLVAREV